MTDSAGDAELVGLILSEVMSTGLAVTSGTQRPFRSCRKTETVAVRDGCTADGKVSLHSIFDSFRWSRKMASRTLTMI